MDWEFVRYFLDCLLETLTEFKDILIMIKSNPFKMNVVTEEISVAIAMPLYA